MYLRVFAIIFTSVHRLIGNRTPLPISPSCPLISQPTEHHGYDRQRPRTLGMLPLPIAPTHEQRVRVPLAAA